jgi:hypothetical protein
MQIWYTLMESIRNDRHETQNRRKKMKDIVKNMWNGILEGEAKKEEATFVPNIPVDEEGEFVAYLVRENDKGIYSTENGSRAFGVRKSGEAVDAAWTCELGTYQATTHTAFMIACEMFSKEISDWMDDGIIPN